MIINEGDELNIRKKRMYNFVLECRYLCEEKNVININQKKT